MNAVQQFLTSEFAVNLAIALMHTLWQGAIVAGLLLVGLKAIPAAKSGMRYKLSIIAMLVMTICWPATYSILHLEGNSTGEAKGADSYAAASINENVVAVEETVKSETQKTADRALSDTPAKRVNMPTENTAASSNPIYQPVQSSTIGLGWIIVFWSAGLMVMLVRIFVQLTGVARLKRDAIDIDQKDLLDMFADMCTSMGITRKIRFAASAVLVHPGVIGFWRPVLLIPASMLTNTPPDHLQAIIAHELAHIRRYDYLVNLCQMVVEAIFFFNPAVWWISRQVRIEREACCDIAGINVTGRRLKYAQVLVDAIARNMPQSQSSMPAAFTGFSDNDTSANADRVKRIVDPQHTPHMKIGSIKLVMLLLLAAFAVFGIWKATDVSVNTVAKLLTPKERIEKIEQIAESYSIKSSNFSENDRVTLSGTVTTIDGKPLPEYPNVTIHAHGGISSSSTSISIDKDGKFKHTVQCRESVFVSTSAPGYAPGFSKTYNPKPDEVIDNINIVLDYGFAANVKVVDEQGRPVSGAELSNMYFYETNGGWGSYGGVSKTVSGENGVAVFEQSISRPVKLDVYANGYQKIEDMDVAFMPGEDIVVTLREGLVASGVVSAKETGEPISGAKLRLVYKERPGHGWHMSDGRYEAETDAEGRFVLNQLSDNFKYSYIVEADGFNRSVLPLVQHGENNLKVEMAPVLHISGKVTGDLSKIGSNYCSSIKKTVPALNYRCRFINDEYGNRYEGLDENDSVPVEIVDGVGYFTISNIIGNEVTLSSPGRYAVNKMATIRLEGKSIDDIVVNLDETGNITSSATRQVVINFKAPDGYPPVNGEVGLWYMTKEVEQSSERSWSGLNMEVVDGAGRVDFPVPAYIRLAEIGELKGYWLEPEPWNTNARTLIEQADVPYEKTIIAEPGGSIYGQILDENGKLMRYSELSIDFVKRPQRYKDVSNLYYIKTAINAGLEHKQTETGRFNSAALPLDASYVVIARKDDTRLVSEPIELTNDNPIREITLKLDKSYSISGQIFMPDKAPASDIAVLLQGSVKLPGDAGGNTHTSLAKMTDAQGRFEFTGINKSKDITYTVKLDSPRDVQPIYDEVKPGSNTKFYLKKAYRITGRVIDDETGWPIMGASVNAYSTADRYSWERQRLCEEKTGKDGEFIISTLGSEEYRLDVVGCKVISADESKCIIKGGRKKHIEIRVRIDEGWKRHLHPQEPANTDS